MKYYKELVQKDNTELILPCSDSQSFIFSFPASACKKAKTIAISLYFDNYIMYRITFYPSATQTSCYDDEARRYVYGWLGDDSANMVFRVDKTFPNSLTTYINDQLIRLIPTCVEVNPRNQINTAGVAINSTDLIPITLTTFEYEEYGSVGDFSTAMRNPVSSDLETEDERKALEERLSADGVDDANSSSVVDIRPQDTKWMKYSSTVVWPIAIELEAVNLKISLQKKHDTLMREWVVGHGDNTSLDTHNYFVHSHSIAWPKALASMNVDKATKIRERHAQLFKNLP